MPIVNLRDAAKGAEENHYGIGAYNINSMPAMRGILKAAETLRSPVILSFAEAHFPYMDFELLLGAAVRAAEKASVPVVLHLDHGQTFTSIMQAIRYGASSVMIDASAKPFAENLALTQEIVRLCQPLGISVEGELGCIGGDGEGDGSEHEADSRHFTAPDQAAEYAKQSGIDALAIAFGNVHGQYSGEPCLDFGLLENISWRLQIPLVLHGGSGISDGDFQKAITFGIRKINFYTKNSLDCQNALAEYRQVHPHSEGKDMARLWNIIADIHCDNAMHNMRVWGSAGQI